MHDSDAYNPVPGVMEGVPSSRNYEGGFATKLMVITRTCFFGKATEFILFFLLNSWPKIIALCLPFALLTIFIWQFFHDLFISWGNVERSDCEENIKRQLVFNIHSGYNICLVH